MMLYRIILPLAHFLLNGSILDSHVLGSDVDIKTETVELKKSQVILIEHRQFCKDLSLHWGVTVFSSREAESSTMINPFMLTFTWKMA